MSKNRQDTVVSNQVDNTNISKAGLSPASQNPPSSDFLAKAAVIDQETVKAPEPVEVAPKPAEYKKPEVSVLNTGPKVSNDDAFIASISDKLNRLSTNGYNLFNQFIDYANKMAPGIAMDDKLGAKYQANLWSYINNLCNNIEDRDFNTLYRCVLLAFNHYPAFGIDYIYRFANVWPMGDVQRAAFRRITTLMISTANPTIRRQVLKGWGWRYTLEFGLTDKGKTRLRGFYKV